MESETAINPWVALSWIDSPYAQLALSQRWAQEKFNERDIKAFAQPKQRSEKIKVGYYSADFHNHPGMYLMSGMLASHNRQIFEIHAFSYGPNYKDEMREAIINNVDQFYEIEKLSDEQVCRLSRELSIDIAINRNGYTRNGRTEIFEHRIAPVQINFLGYPGTLGAPFMDYIIADTTVIPEKYRKFYSERIIYMPHSYQPTDNSRQIPNRFTMRKECGLPNDAFVLCCFNNDYKINVSDLTIWMRLLRRIPGSVLWLLKSNVTAVKNLKDFAKSHDINPERLIFAEFVPHSHHLSRLCHADLFVDTFNYNAHTTASDALYAGVPVVSKIGKQFSARVAASLLHAIGLPELVVYSEEEYEELIFDLASSPERLSSIKSKLQKNKLTEPLFDTRRYTRNFEKGLGHAYGLYRNNILPHDIHVVDVFER